MKIQDLVGEVGALQGLQIRVQCEKRKTMLVRLCEDCTWKQKIEDVFIICEYLLVFLQVRSMCSIQALTVFIGTLFFTQRKIE